VKYDSAKAVFCKLSEINNCINSNIKVGYLIEYKYDSIAYSYSKTQFGYNHYFKVCSSEPMKDGRLAMNHHIMLVYDKDLKFLHHVKMPDTEYLDSKVISRPAVVISKEGIYMLKVSDTATTLIAFYSTVDYYGEKNQVYYRSDCPEKSSCSFEYECACCEISKE
jgi:hypothetical protein